MPGKKTKKKSKTPDYSRINIDKLSKHVKKIDQSRIKGILKENGLSLDTFSKESQEFLDTLQEKIQQKPKTKPKTHKSVKFSEKETVIPIQSRSTIDLSEPTEPTKPTKPKKISPPRYRPKQRIPTKREALKSLHHDLEFHVLTLEKELNLLQHLKNQRLKSEDVPKILRFKEQINSRKAKIVTLLEQINLYEPPKMLPNTTTEPEIKTIKTVSIGHQHNSVKPDYSAKPNNLVKPNNSAKPPEIKTVKLTNNPNQIGHLNYIPTKEPHSRSQHVKRIMSRGSSNQPSSIKRAHNTYLQTHQAKIKEYQRYLNKQKQIQELTLKEKQNKNKQVKFDDFELYPEEELPKPKHKNVKRKSNKTMSNKAKWKKIDPEEDIKINPHHWKDVEFTDYLPKTRSTTRLTQKRAKEELTKINIIKPESKAPDHLLNYLLEVTDDFEIITTPTITRRCTTNYYIGE